MVLHNQYPWNRSDVQLTALENLKDDDLVVVFKPKNADVTRFLHKITQGAPRASTGTRVASFQPEVQTKQPIRPYPPLDVRKQFTILPKIEALAVARGELLCSNEDLIRNTAYCWSPMTAEEISEKTGIETRMYTSRGLDEIALEASLAALERAGRQPEEIGAVLFCSCTNHRLIPSMAAWLSGQLGIFQTHSSADIIAACAGLPYGLSEAVRLLQEVNRPVLLVCGEKFSDKIGTVRPSRMIFGDGAAAFVIAPAADDEDSDIDLMQTYASGPVSQVNSIIWPNAAFDNNITVFGPEVKVLAGRYLEQMISELGAQSDPCGVKESAWDTVELVVPHQANKTMVIGLAEKAGLSADLIYFNIERAGNTSSASIPIAIADAVQDGVIDRPMTIFAPGFGAGSVGGYTIMRVDPAVVVTESRVNVKVAPDDGQSTETGSEGISTAFGG
jgi:3-oxoacyl-[acyl-carrier-protein] synthase III